MLPHALGAILMLAAAAQDPSPAARVDAVFKEYDSATSPGCAVAVFQGDKILYQRAYGMANLDHDVRLSTSSVFHVASVSKQFTAAAILLLAQDGKLGLDDDIRKHVPELPDFGATITIRQLANHTSGIRDQWDLLGLAGWRYSRDLITDDDVLELLAQAEGSELPAGHAPPVFEQRLYAAGGDREPRQRQVLPRIHDRADFRAARHDQHAFPRRLQRDRQEPGIRLCAVRADVPSQHHELRYGRRDQPADDRRGHGEVVRELRHAARWAATTLARRPAGSRRAEGRYAASTTPSASPTGRIEARRPSATVAPTRAIAPTSSASRIHASASRRCATSPPRIPPSSRAASRKSFCRTARSRPSSSRSPTRVPKFRCRKNSLPDTPASTGTRPTASSGRLSSTPPGGSRPCSAPGASR